MDAITNAGDMTGDGRPDVLARDTTGRLWLYPMTNAAFQARRPVGFGWGVMSSILGPGDVSGDGRADILARDAGGSLWLYRGSGTGRVAARTLVSTGWAAKTALASPGNWDRAGGNDLFTRDAVSTGGLWFHPGNNAGGFGPPTRVGGGWNGMSFIG